MSQLEKTVVTMKLETEDYQNIYLQVREKLLRWIFGSAIFGLAVVGVSGYAVFKNSVAKGVDQYVQTEAFKGEVTNAMLEKLSYLESRASDISEQLRHHEVAAARLASIPISVGPHGLQVIGQDGRKFSVEMGTTGAGDKVGFSSTFRSIPTVLVYPLDGQAEVRQRGMSRDNTVGVRVPTEARIDGFTAPKVFGAFSPTQYQWIAIGF